MPTAKHLPDPDTLLTAAEIAHIVRVDPVTVNRWARDGRLPVAFRTPTGRRRFHLADVERLLAGDTGTDGDTEAAL